MEITFHRLIFFFIKYNNVIIYTYNFTREITKTKKFVNDIIVIEFIEISCVKSFYS